MESNPTQTPQFNYKPPIPNGKDKFLIEPNFQLSGPLAVNKFLAIARNSEVPELLKVTGALTEEENQSILYQNLKTNEVLHMGTKEKNITVAGYLDPRSFSERSPKAYNAAVEAQKMALLRDEVKPEESKLELILGGGKRSKHRCYTLGFTVNPQAMAAGSAPVNKVMLQPENKAYVIKFLQLLTEALMGPVETLVSQEELDLARTQREIDVPFTFGLVQNYLFTSAQLNYSNFGEVELQETLGAVGGLHVDGNDSPNHWTTLLNLSNLPEGCSGGRTLVTSTRTYFQWTPQGRAAAVFRAVHPHLSIGPAAIDPNLDREPSHFEIPEGDEELDPEMYISARVMAVGYAKDHIMKKSPEIQRNLTPALYKQAPYTKTNTPDRLPEALLAFGTVENQATWYAMAFALNQARNAQNNPSLVPLTATEISHNFRFISEDGAVSIPIIHMIQATLQGNSAAAKRSLHRIKWIESDKFCRSILSQHWFPTPSKKSKRISWTSKKGTIEWVAQSAIGFTFYHFPEDPEKPVKKPEKFSVAEKDAMLEEEFGKHPFGCEHCKARFPKQKRCELHHNKAHETEYEWDPVDPDIDPKFPPKTISDKTPNPPATKADKRGSVEKEGDSNAEGAEDESEEESEDGEEESANPPIIQGQKSSNISSRKRKFGEIIDDDSDSEDENQS